MIVIQLIMYMLKWVVISALLSDRYKVSKNIKFDNSYLLVNQKFVCMFVEN